MITQSDIEKAHERIKPFVHRTPVMTCAQLDERTGANVFFKCEHLQKVGAFKARGATNTLLLLQAEGALKNGVLTHSSGNHAQALAWAARKVGAKAYVVMPKDSPKVKVDAVKGYGAEITFCEPTLEARESTAEEVQKNIGAYFVHPYDDYRIIAGQATSAKEFLEDHPGLDFIYCPVGGGGLLAGTALSNRFWGRAKVLGCEPDQADDAYRSFTSGKWQPSINPKTIADGLKTSLGQKNFPIIKEHVSRIETVTEDEIKNALRYTWERTKQLIEPSSAVAIACLLKNSDALKGKRVGIIISGGNVDLDDVCSILRKGL